ncbi:hypothetical protein DKL61_15290 [Gammaproteobacteria bacterium ESL0073]|nr:hypothetical protein DKL61_15290 [Gammaproteobacteria bacterium ESL0073]
MSHKNENNSLTRKILQLNSIDGYDLAQDFYPTGEKRTDPFLLKQNYKENLYPYRKNEFDYDMLPIKDKQITAYYLNGTVESTLLPTPTRYYFNGNKLEERIKQEVFYYPDGQISCILDYRSGSENKPSSYKRFDWHKNGRLAYQCMDNIRTNWDESGQKTLETIEDKDQGLMLITTWYPNNKIKYQGYLKENSPHGEWKYWHDNGQLYLSGQYNEGKKEGLWVSWYPDGSKLSELFYQHGLAEGKLCAWYPDGKPRLEAFFLEDKLQGLCSSYHPFESTCSQITFEHGCGTGHWIEWHSSGQPYLECDFDKGNKEGLFSLWYDNGQLQEQGEMRNGYQYGLWSYWYKNGQLRQQQTFKLTEGFTDSKEEYYTSIDYFNFYDFFCFSPCKNVIGTFFGKTSGRETYWYENGQKAYEGDVEHFRIGFWQFWYDNGQLRAQGDHTENGFLKGVWQFWGEDGTPLAEYRSYDNGVAGNVPNEFRWDLIY